MKDHVFWKLLLAIMFVVAFGGPIAIAMCGCAKPPKMAPRETARAAVVTLAQAASVADKTCATLALKTGNIPLAKKCGDAYDVARPALLAAESAVDAWDDASAKRVACSLASALDALWQISEALKVAGAKAPAVIEDAIKFATPFSGGC